MGSEGDFGREGVCDDAENTVQAGKVWIEMDNIEKGIVEVVAQHGIRCLVMGAAADKHYSEYAASISIIAFTKKLSELTSSKAKFVCQQAPVSCDIWFACNGRLICRRSASISSHVASILALSSPTRTKETTLLQSHAADEDGVASKSVEFATRLTNKVLGTVKSTPLQMDEMRDSSPLSSPHGCQDRLLRSSSASLLEVTPQEHAACDMYYKLEHARIDAENSKRKAFEESVRRWKAEEDATEALRKAEASEASCMEELKQRKEMEEMLAIQTQELERMKNQHDHYIKEIQMVRDQKPVLERQIKESSFMEKELEEKIIQAVKLLITFKEKRDELQEECKEANRDINKLRKSVVQNSMSLSGPHFPSYSFLEIIEATQNFDPSRKIGEGRCGSVYKGLLQHTKVAVRMLPFCGSQGGLEFEDEVRVLSMVRHPNLVTLIGTCPESRSLIYEYLENGSLEDHLACRGKAPPLPWHARIRIASEICSALVFLHSNNPCFIHGNVNLKSILLDANLVSKLGDFGIYRLIPDGGDSVYPTTLSIKIKPEASVYMDPEFLMTGKLTTGSDVYSFGVILLRMLTGRPAWAIVNDVKCALEKGNFDEVLDFSAGDWAVEQAKQLARLALRCCEEKHLSWPDLVSDVWTVIEPMRNLCSPPCLESEGQRRIPSHFVCPIFQEVMQDPYVAADGFTYEADAIKGWLNSGHKTSPMTNLKLEHCDLLPNYALYYAIQEWLQQS
ncbi:hypothetical protein RJ639_030076 [Escallonia herrerae]|uniref:RING-type E3 ubiquitin transferase n=1 Tax=Escallonia herrerae TaxID=1293975 RepID=A0AA89BDR0_9ASTE|nr:hypothetical protein RJ639_030076 [Escallonia herrerae]